MANAGDEVTKSTAIFKDVAAISGLTFKHQLGDSGKFYIVENTAPGCAFLDYNNDDFLDVFLVQSGATPGTRQKERPPCALYRNNGDGTFQDVTSGSGLDADFGYGQGVAVGDYDNDGYDDLFVTAYGGNHLLRNLGGKGKWKDVTAATGLDKVHGTGYATSAAFGDYDGDSRLDLYVCYYLKWTVGLNKICRNNGGVQDYCSPSLYEPATHRLYRNTGKTFIDVSGQTGISSRGAWGLAVAFFDYNQDKRQDIFVANDLTANMLWQNQGNGTFKDVAIQTGCAYGEDGRAMAGMGIAIADYDRSGRESVFVTNYSKRPNILFKNVGGLFEESSETTRLFEPTSKFLSFGCEFFDYDADGWQDIMVNNGHVAMFEPQREKDIPYKQRKQLLRNMTNGTFAEIADEAALGDLIVPQVGRGLAVGDYDNDGRLDVLASNQNAPAQLFRNQAKHENRWISFQLRGRKSNRNGVHARLVLKAGKTQQNATVRGGSSYLSSSDRRVYFGLGDVSKIDQVVVQWPAGTVDTLKNLQPNMFYTITEGQGITRKFQPKR